MTSSSADIFNRLQLFRTGRSDDEQDSDPERPKPNPATSRVKRCLFGRGNSEENIKFAKRELEKSLTESKNKWNFDFENERPMDGRFQWETSPYPKPISLKNRMAAAAAQAAAENVENLHPSSGSGSPSGGTSGAGTADNISSSASPENHPSSKHTSSNNTSSDEQICDPPALPPGAASIASSRTDPDTKSSSSDSIPSPSNQRTRSRPINQIYRQRKRSKSKVKIQDRKSDKETEENLLATMTSKTASVLGGGGVDGASYASQESD